MRVLITGHKGFAGSHLQPALLQARHEVIGVDIVDGFDVRSYELVRAVIEQNDPDWIIHLAAQAYVAEGTTDPARAVDVNVLGTLNVLEAVRQTGSRARVHIAGTSEEYGYHGLINEQSPLQPGTPYGASKAGGSLLGLAYAECYGMDVIVTRAFNHTGPGQAARYAVSAFAKRVASVQLGLAERVAHGDLSAVRDFTDVRDVTRAYIRLLESGEPGVYNICSGVTVTMQFILDQLCALSGGLVPTKLDESLYRPQPQRHFLASHDKISAAVGWAPQFELDRTLADLLAYWKRTLG